MILHQAKPYLPHAPLNQKEQLLQTKKEPEENTLNPKPPNPQTLSPKPKTARDKINDPEQADMALAASKAQDKADLEAGRIEVKLFFLTLVLFKFYKGLGFRIYFFFTLGPIRVQVVLFRV